MKKFYFICMVLALFGSLSLRAMEDDDVVYQDAVDGFSTTSSEPGAGVGGGGGGAASAADSSGTLGGGESLEAQMIELFEARERRLQALGGGGAGTQVDGTRGDFTGSSVPGSGVGSGGSDDVSARIVFDLEVRLFAAHEQAKRGGVNFQCIPEYRFVWDMLEGKQCVTGRDTKAIEAYIQVVQQAIDKKTTGSIFGASVLRNVYVRYTAGFAAISATAYALYSGYAAYYNDTDLDDDEEVGA